MPSLRSCMRRISTKSTCRMCWTAREWGVRHSTYTIATNKTCSSATWKIFCENVSTALKRDGASPNRLLPVKELFTHIRPVREFYSAVVNSGRMNDVQALGRGFFARSIEERLQTGGVDIEPLRRSAQAPALVGSFFSLLDWWIDKEMKADPKEMDQLFHRMAWSGLAVRYS